MEKIVPVMAVKKAFDLLEMLHFGLSADKEGLPLSEIARAAGMKPNSARNLLKTMIVCGYVEQTESSRYLPGPKCRQMGVLNRAIAKSGEGSVTSFLTELTAKIEEASVFTVIVGGNRVILGTVEANREIKVSKATIQSDSVFWTQTGRVMAAYSSPAELAQIIERNGMPGEKWDGIEDMDALQKAISSIRKAGNCVFNRGETLGFGLPAFGRDGKFVGAIGCYAPSYRCPQEKQKEILAQLKSYAAKIAASLE